MVPSSTTMRLSLAVRSFLPFAAKFLARHPTRFGLLVRHWRDYSSRAACLKTVTEKEQDLIESLFYELECKKTPFDLRSGWSVDPIHPAVYYALVRLTRPDVVVETGVCEGNSSRFILLGFHHNEHGVLHSIDLPNADLDLGEGKGRQTHVHAEGKEVGWMVPENLRKRWTLHLGDAKELLPGVLKTLGSIDIFIHDSLHSYEHMMFEFHTAWPHLRRNGILLSDDIDWNDAFGVFSRQMRCTPAFFNYRVAAIRKEG